MEAYKVSRIMHFGPGTRLMCPDCGAISNNHKPHSPRREFYWDKTSCPVDVCLHTCFRCGYTDEFGSGFTDSGNDYRDEFRNLNQWETELLELKDEVAALEYRVQEARELYEHLWQTEEDR